MCRPLLPVISRLQASQEVEGKRLDWTVPKSDLLPEFLLVLLSQEAVQDPHSRQKHATGMMQVPSIQIRVQHHERHRGQNASTVSHRKIAEEAEREYRAVLKEDSQDGKSILRLAEIDAEKGNTRQSYDGYTKAVALKPGDADAKPGLAKALTEMNQTDKAQKLLEEAVQL
jgi:cytochrome c-type biogenesis protein CcmH/NrfG